MLYERRNKGVLRSATGLGLRGTFPPCRILLLDSHSHDPDIPLSVVSLRNDHS